MGKRRRYTVRDKKTGEMLAVGVASECAKILDVPARTLSDIANGHNSGKYDIEYEDLPSGRDVLELAAEWDKFRKPICEKFGIPYQKKTIK